MSGVLGDEETASAAAAPHHVAPSGSLEATREALKYGPRGALTIASVSIALFILGWLAFYFLLFIPRGEIH